MCREPQLVLLVSLLVLITTTYAYRYIGPRECTDSILFKGEMISAYGSSFPMSDLKKKAMHTGKAWMSFVKEPTHHDYITMIFSHCIGLYGILRDSENLSILEHVMMYHYNRMAMTFGEAQNMTDNLDALIHFQDIKYLSVRELDLLWMIYDVTKNITYPLTVRSVAECLQCYPLVRGAAAWSFNAHVDSGSLPGMERILELDIAGKRIEL